jgi:hypothetical protein
MQGSAPETASSNLPDEFFTGSNDGQPVPAQASASAPVPADDEFDEFCEAPPVTKFQKQVNHNQNADLMEMFEASSETAKPEKKEAVLSL